MNKNGVIYDITELIGNTPMLKADRYAAAKRLQAELYVKLEYLNPTGSVKDRAALGMIRDGIRKGKLGQDTVLIEPTSGNTGIAIAAIGASMGLRVILTMPETMSTERRNILQSLGAEIVLTEGSRGMKGAIEKAHSLLGEMENALILGQFENPANPDAHFTGTGPEIWEQMDGDIDILVSGVGTGGTLTGAGAFLKSRNPALRIVAVEPADSPVLSGGSPGPHKIQGIGAGFIPPVLHTELYDEILRISGEDAFEESRLFAKTEGILQGISAGAALNAAAILAQRPENEGKKIVVILPDSGDRYFSTALFSLQQ